MSTDMMMSGDAQQSFQEGRRSANHEDIEGKVFVGGLSWQTTEASLRFYFEKFGELSDAAIMTDKRTGQPRGFGFITMKDAAAADIVVATEHTIDGRVVDVKRAVPRDMAPAPSRSESKKVFVGGLPAEVSEKEFADFFSKFGTVKDAVVMVDRATSRSRGFGFITFEHEESVENCIRTKNEIMGKFVEVKRAEPRDAREGGRGVPMGGQGMSMYGGPAGMGGMMGMGGYGRGDQRDNRGGRGGYSAGGMYGAGGRGMMMGPQGDYSAYASPYSRAGAVPGGYGMRYPAGYGGASLGAGRGGYPGGAAASPYGYPPAGGMGQGMGYGYPGPGYGGYGAAAGASGATGGYGAASGSSAAYGGGAYAAQSRGADGSGGEQNSAAGDYGSNTGSMGLRGGAEQNAAGGYAGAQMPSAYSYNAAPMSGYGGSYGMYGATGAAPNVQSGQGQRSSAGSSPNGDAVGADASYGQQGGMRGQGATQGRIDRSYRPY